MSPSEISKIAFDAVLKLELSRGGDADAVVIAARKFESFLKREIAMTNCYVSNEVVVGAQDYTSLAIGPFKYNL